MTNTEDRQHRSILQRIAHQAMLENGLAPDFPSHALAELDRIHEPAKRPEGSTRDLRNLLWCSIDNDDSRDLDQLTVAESRQGESDGSVKVLVAIADVDEIVKKRSALDDHARHNTTSVYTVAETFPMLPERLSTDITSLNYESDRLAVVIEMVLSGDGSLRSSDLYRAMVRNHAKLAYNSVAVWLEGNGPMPQEIGMVNDLNENLRRQDRAAQKLKALRHLHGALDLETIEARPVFDGDELKNLEADQKNRAKEIIEDFMIAANGVTARYLDLITQRLLKAAITNSSMPYDDDELETLAKHCTKEKDAAKKVDRQVTKSAAAILLKSRIGEQFDAIVTGASPKGTWVRLLQPPVEGRLERGSQGLDVGDRVHVKLIHTDIERGFIDFAATDTHHEQSSFVKVYRSGASDEE